MISTEELKDFSNKIMEFLVICSWLSGRDSQKGEMKGTRADKSEAKRAPWKDLHVV